MAENVEKSQRSVRVKINARLKRRTNEEQPHRPHKDIRRGPLDTYLARREGAAYQSDTAETEPTNPDDELKTLATIAQQKVGDIKYGITLFGKQGTIDILRVSQGENLKTVVDGILGQYLSVEEARRELGGVLFASGMFGRMPDSVAYSCQTIGFNETIEAAANPSLDRYTLEDVANVAHLTGFSIKTSATDVLNILSIAERHGMDAANVAQAYPVLGFWGTELACMESREFDVPLAVTAKNLSEKQSSGVTHEQVEEFRIHYCTGPEGKTIADMLAPVPVSALNRSERREYAKKLRNLATDSQLLSE